MRIRPSILLASIGVVARAQSPAVPQAYSFTQVNNVMTPGMVVKVYRDGPRELLDRMQPASPDSPQGFHMRTLYDFQAHKLFTWDLIETSRPCGIQDNTEAVPAMFDVISGAAAMAGETAKVRPKTPVIETVAGGPAWTRESPDPQGRGTIKQWFAMKGDYLLKMVLVAKSGPSQVLVEVKDLSFDKPAASALALPATCSAAPSSSSAPAASSPAAAQAGNAETTALPPNFSLPAGFTIDARNSRQFDYSHVEIGYVKSGAMTHIDPAGRAWSPMMKLATPNKTGDETDKQMRASLTSQGWELLTPSGTLVAHKTANGREMWFNGAAFAGDYRATIVEVGPPPHSLTLPTPAATPETVGPTEDFPYLLSFPGSKLIRSLEEPGKSFNAAMPGKPEELVGFPLLRKLYQAPASVSMYEFVAVYRDALAKAGWTIIRTAAGSDAQVIAHWARNGRDIFVYLATDGYQVADVGAQNEAKKLAADLARDGHVAVYGIYFDIDQATLKPESEVALQHVLELLKGNASLKLEVQGHTDNTGASPHNQVLSEQRAASVRTWLVGHGVTADRLAPKGYGDTQPVADNKTPDGRAKNRRVELKKN